MNSRGGVLTKDARLLYCDKGEDNRKTNGRYIALKKVIIKTLGVALALALLCGAALAEVKTTGNVWMRKGPGLNYDQVTSFSSGKSLTYEGESSVDDRGVTWYKVTSGNNTGWVSSKYSRLVGEDAQPAATEVPVATKAPAAEPVPTKAAEPVSTEQPAPEETAKPSLTEVAGSVFLRSLVGSEEAEDATEQGGAQPAPVSQPALPEKAVELSNYYRSELVVAANELGLISYRQVESEVPYQYYNDAVIVAGNQNVENIVVYGAGYEVYGVRVGMNANTAMAYLNAAGLDYVKDAEGVTYEHRGDAASGFFVDENGHDSCINLWIDEDNVVTEIDWSTYTG